MTCAELTASLQLLLDQRCAMPLPPHAIAHVAGCQHCRELYQAALAMRHAIASAPRPVPPADFPAHVVMAWQVRQRRLQFTRRCFALAASLLIVGLAVWAWCGMRQPPAGSVEVLVAKNVPKPPTMPSKPLQLQAASQATLELGRTVVALAWHDASVFVPPDVAKTHPAPNAAQSPEVILPDVSRSVNQGLEPVTASTQQAWSAWARLVPVPKEERKRS